MYATNNGAAEYLKQKLIGAVNKFTIVVGDFNTPLPTTDRTRQKISKNIEEFNNTIKQQDLTDISRTLHPTTEYTFFSSVLKHTVR